ncbi:glycosyltransferase family 2 protein [Sphaerothrix gracilis]|uniref:glycosyltransferase family 2 protein n=1 Tax=Sphaerothrix gracilis TaxID=3151835 RepID=UPI0031FCC339
MSSPTNIPLTHNIQIRLRDRTLLFRYLAVINLIIGGWYLYWRWTQSLNMDVVWFSVPLALAEAYMYLGGALFLIGLWRPIQRQVRSLCNLVPALSESDYPTVDVFITCYNEPTEIVEATAGAALQMNYPVEKLRIYILDDGNSPAMRAMAERLCLNDLRTPALQQLANRLNAERYSLQSRLEQLQQLRPELEAVERLLTSQKIQVHSEYQELSQVMCWFETLRSPIVPEDIWLACQTLLGEGFDNAICHAHKHLSPQTPIELEVVVLTSAVILRIWDQGRPFDFEGQLQRVPAEVDAEAERGRGLSILSQLANHVSYVRTHDDRNCLTLVKSFTPQLASSKTAHWQQAGYLQSMRELLLLSHSDQLTATAVLEEKVQALERKIDSKTKAMTDLARCRYIAREKPEGRPHHAKAGNINHAIFCGETQGDFILTLDADHIPKTQFLQRVLPHFFRFNLDQGRYELNRVAFVQTPQAFHNLPKKDPFGHDAHLFYGPIQQGKDGMNSAFYTGTNAVLSREALVNMGLQHFADDFVNDEQRLAEFDLIGGLSSISITEDMNTAMRLHSTGWQSAYHDEILAEGLAPDDLSSTLKQKLRWAQGTLQVLLRDNPLLKPGLTVWQRLQYFQTMYSYFAGFFIAVFLVCPIISLFTGLIPVSSYGADFALHFIPAYVINRLTFITIGWEVSARELWRNEQYAIALFPLQIQAVLSVFRGKKIDFKVTPKQRQSGIYIKLVRIQLAVAVLTGLAMIWGLACLLLGYCDSPWTYLINFGWGVYHIALLSAVIRAACWQPKASMQFA